VLFPRHSREGGNPALLNSKKSDPRFRGGDALFLFVALCLTTPAAAQDKKPPYWASIASGEAMMRSGPGKNYPGVWLYKRRDLPIRVIKTYPNWRMIEDPDGTRGWMLVTLLSDRRTGIVKQGRPRTLHVEPSESSAVRYRAEAGVVGRIEKCGGGWCRFKVGKREGHIRMSDIWGVSPNEVIDD
jgi:SH3-like domain-containing protein